MLNSKDLILVLQQEAQDTSQVGEGRAQGWKLSGGFGTSYRTGWGWPGHWAGEVQSLSSTSNSLSAIVIYRNGADVKKVSFCPTIGRAVGLEGVYGITPVV